MSETPGSTAETLVAVDRIEGAWAVLVVQEPTPTSLARGDDEPARGGPPDDAFDFPLDLLPAGTREGDVLRLRVTRDAALGRQAIRATEALQARLLGDDDGGDIVL